MARTAVNQAEIRYRLYGRIIEATGSIIHRAIPWGGVSLIAYFAYLSIRVLAGQQTLASIVVRFLADFRVNEYVAYLFGMGGVVYGLRNRKLRKDNIERMAQRIRDLETQLDARRSSSRLTPRGETRPEDKP